MSQGSDFLDYIFSNVRRIVREELRGEDPRFVEQEGSPLGRRRHIAAVKKRLAQAAASDVPSRQLGAMVKGKRRFLLSQEAVAEERALREIKAARHAVTGPPEPERDEGQAAYDDFMARARARADERKGDQ